jgi:predicted PurR-regulated permease PerM
LFLRCAGIQLGLIEIQKPVNMETTKLPFYARLALTLLAVVLTCLILSLAQNIFIPLIFGLLIAILLYPLNKFFEFKMRLGRTLSPILCIVLFVSAAVGFIYFLALQFIGFSGDFPQLRKRFLLMVDDVQHWLHYKLHINNSQQTEYLNKSMTEITGSIAHSISNVFVSVTGVLLLTIFVLIFTFFILFYRKLLMKFVLYLFRAEHQVKVNEVIVETKRMIYAYVFGLVIEMVLVSVVNCTMFLIMGVQYALLLGVMAAVLNIIPYLGIYSSIVICMLVTLANSNGAMAAEVGIGLFVVHLLDSNILFPRIIGGRVKMNPFITIVAVIVGQFLWGVPGMFLFIPITGIIKLICERVEGLEAWSLLIGVEEVEPKPQKKIRISKKKAEE